MKAERIVSTVLVNDSHSSHVLMQQGVMKCPFLSQVHSERRTPQMETERRAMLLVGLVIDAYLKGRGGEDWRFCLAASQLLVETAKNNVTKGSTAEIQSLEAHHFSELAGPSSQFANAQHRCCRYESCL